MVNYRRLRWSVFLAASLFLAFFQLATRRTETLWEDLLWQGVLYGVVLLFTFALFGRLEQMQDHARQQSDSFRALFEANGVAIILVGSDCMIREVNHSAVALSGWSRQELIGRKACSELLTSPDCGPLGCPGLCSQVMRTANGEEMLRLLGLNNRAGEQVQVMASIVQLSGDGPSGGFAYLLWDISERARLEQEAAMRRKQAEGLREIGLEIAALSDLGSGLGRVLDRARDLFRMDLVAWGMLDEAAESITWQTARGMDHRPIAGAVLPVSGTVMGRVLLAGRPFVTHNLAAQSGQSPEARTLFSEPDLQTAMVVPLRVRENSYGVLLCASTTVLDLTDEEVMLFTHLASYLATAVENGQLLEQVQHMATLEERQRLARELHDSFGQILTYLGVRNHMIRRLAEQGKAEEILKETASLKDVLQEAHTDVRRSIFQLKESGKPRAPLADRWRELLHSFEERSGIEAAYGTAGKIPAHLPEQMELQLTRILQEALANVRNHSGARSVAVRVTATEQQLQIQVTDDGCGFEMNTVHGPDQHHFGLSIMRERAAALGAELEVRSRRGHGTTVSIQVPLLTKEGESHGGSSHSRSAG